MVTDESFAKVISRRYWQQTMSVRDGRELVLPRSAPIATARARLASTIGVVLRTLFINGTRKELHMSRSAMLFSVVLVLGGLLGGAESLPRAMAQDATPVVAVPPSWNIPGIEVIASVEDPSLAPGMVLEFDRITWAPGFAVPMHYHPAIDILYVVSGSVAWSVEEGTAQVYRAAVVGTPGPTEILEPGGEAVLGPGDVIVFDYPKTGMRHAARVVGDAPVIMLDQVLYDPSQELTQFPEGVTPVPEG